MKKKNKYKVASAHIPAELNTRLVAEVRKTGLCTSKIVNYALDYFLLRGGVLNYMQEKHTEK